MDIAPRQRAHAPLTVGVDGSDPSCHAVTWAAQEAFLSHRPMNLLHATAFPLYPGPAQAGALAVPEASRSAAFEIVRQARRVARQAVRQLGAQVRAEEARAAGARDGSAEPEPAPEITISTEIVEGLPSQILIERSATSSMVVTGRHGGDGDLGVLGPVSSQLVTYAHGPVVVVPPPALPPAPPAPGGPGGPGVVAGVDPGQNLAAVLSFALDQADRRRLPLTAVRAWNLLTDGPAIRADFPTSADLETSQRQLLSEALAGGCMAYPDVPIHERLVRQRAVPALLDASQDAALLVVGARGRGGFPRLLLGGVAEAVVRHAGCAVAVVR
jgi:nucleotide-binding universal stress UspA family protein